MMKEKFSSLVHLLNGDYSLGSPLELLFYNPNRNSFLKLRRILRSLQKLVCSLGEQRTALKQVTGCLI